MANIFHVHRVNDTITLGQSTTTVTVNPLTASKLVATDASKVLTSAVESLSPTFVDLTLSSPSNIYALSHDSFADFVADEHFLQTAITNISTALSTGILKVTTGTGALSSLATDITGAELEELSDGSETTLHSHADGGTDEKVKIDAAATAGYIGAVYNDGVLRTSTVTIGGLSYTDGGDYITLALAINSLAELDPPTLSMVYIPVYNTGSSTQYKVLGTKFGMFVDRGDAAGSDWDETTLTKDANWHDLDCSPVVPANAKAILFYVIIEDNSADRIFRMRKNGNSNEISVSALKTQVANIDNYADFVVMCDSNRKVEYAASSGTWTRIDIVIKGWWF